jgi:capsular polysaccharide export protein
LRLAHAQGITDGTRLLCEFSRSKNDAILERAAADIADQAVARAAADTGAEKSHEKHRRASKAKWRDFPLPRPSALSARVGEGLLRGPRFWAGPAPRVSALVAEEADSFAAAVESILLSDDWRTPEQRARGRAAIASMVASRIGGDCWAADPGGAALNLPSGATLVVLGGLDRCDVEAERRMLARVRESVGPARVVLVAPGRRVGGRDRRVAAKLAAEAGWRFVDRSLSPWTLLDGAVEVFSTGHEIGFLGLIKGLRVHCFGRPFYAGWGVTIDESTGPPRAARRTSEEIFAAACLVATRYVDPFTGGASTFEVTCDLLGGWRRRNEANRTIAAVVGMSFWKRARIRDLLSSTDGAPAFTRSAKKATAIAKTQGGAVAVWSSREPRALAALTSASGVPLIQIEDGFVRSVGLGADFIPGVSIVADRRGVYFDPRTPSDFEALMSEAVFDEPLVERARRLIEELVRRGVTKYNTGGSAPSLEAPTGVRRIFVPGQVEDDRSIVLGGAGVRGNLDLLERVRAANPDAFIVYKPHPDVVAGHRVGAVAEAEALRYVDKVVRDGSVAELIAAVDEVHTISSLCGFEALLRRRRVVAYGQPFYSGWGLTVDRTPVGRRRRRVTLEELVAGALILYPLYLDPVTRLPCGPEIVVERLSQADLWRPGLLIRLRRLQGMIAGPFRAARKIALASAQSRRVQS